MQRTPVLATGTRRVGLGGAFTGGLKTAHHHRVDRAIALLNTGDVLFQQLAAGDFACVQAGHQFGGGVESEVGHAWPRGLE